MSLHISPLDPWVSMGWAEPIIWGLCNGYSVDDIAAGLDVHPLAVLVAIEAHAPTWLASQIRHAWPDFRDHFPDLDRAQRDWAYANWLRARVEARRLLLNWDKRA
jgi:hypothetical protein